jgi:RNA polymerase sigma factor (sigma-70 family)
MSEELLDNDLVAACMRGDVRAFGRLVERHHGAVTAVAFAITRDLALSEDIAQDTFVIAWTRLGELRDAARVRAWLCNIARNKSKNELRGRKREVAVPADAIDTKPSLVDAAVAREAEAQLRSVLADLPASYREPLVLFYWHEQSIESVASALDITAQVAQKRISRARGYVGEELGTRFDEAGRARRPAKAAAAAVVAVLAMHGAPAASAAGASKLGIGAAKLVAIIAACLAVGAAVWHQTRTRGASASASPPAQPAQAQTASSVGSATSRPSSPSLGSDAHDPDDRAGDDFDPDPKGGFGKPASYEITVLAPTSIAVNLAGGPSSTTLWQDPPPPTFDRHVRGRVVDGKGKPVAGAVVVVGDELRVMFGSLMADGGAKTDANGAFDAVVHVDTALSAIALHAGAGWSAPVAVPAGRADAEVVIRTVASGGLVGSVRRGGSIVDAEITVEGEGALHVNLDTDARGRFELPLLAPGRYRVTARASQLFGGGASVNVERDIVVETGKRTELALELPAGVLVTVTLRDADKLSTAEYFLVPANAAGDASLDHAVLRELGRSGKAMDYLLGGQDVDRVMQFHDITPGVYTLCVDRRFDRDHPLPLLCKKLTVPAGKPVLEVEVGGP